MNTDIIKTLIETALKTRANAHCPISGFKVGAAILSESGKIYAGANAEDPAFNHTIHAEQGAIAQMVAAEGHAKIKHLAVAGGEKGGPLCTPCGHCRQLLVEFADDDLPVTVVDESGAVRLETTLGALLPHAFRLSSFKK